MDSFHHVLITLFNIRYTLSSNLEGLARWTDTRLPLFETYTLPSIVRQDNQNFDWLVVIDPSTTDSQRDIIQSLIQQRKRSYIIEYEDWDLVEGPINDWIQAKNLQVERIITSRVDNDDVLHSGFISQIQDIVKQQKGSFLLNFPNGYCRQLKQQKDLLFAYSAFDNPFMSLVEPLTPNLDTIRRYNHNNWPTDYKRINQETSVGLWMQLLHGKNVVNRIWGKAITKPEFMPYFQMDNESVSYQSSMSHKWEKLKFQIRRPVKKLRSLFQKEPY